MFGITACQEVKRVLTTSRRETLVAVTTCVLGPGCAGPPATAADQGRTCHVRERDLLVIGSHARTSEVSGNGGTQGTSSLLQFN